MISFRNLLGLDMPVANQKTDTGLTMGLLKILHKQVDHRLMENFRFVSFFSFRRREHYH